MAVNSRAWRTLAGSGDRRNDRPVIVLDSFVITTSPGPDWNVPPLDTRQTHRHMHYENRLFES